MVLLLKDTFHKEYAIYQQFLKRVPTSKPKPFRMKNMQKTDNLLLNMEISSLKNAPIQHSDKKQHGYDIRARSRFEGETVLPHFKKDLKSWGVA